MGALIQQIETAAGHLDALPSGWVEVTPGLRWRYALAGSAYASVVRDLDSSAACPRFIVYFYPQQGHAEERSVTSFQSAMRRADGLVRGRSGLVSTPRTRGLLARAEQLVRQAEVLTRRAG
jgi:hypothetical protein